MFLDELVGRADIEPSRWFDAMADAAIRRSILVAADRRFAIMEVEFYLHRADHPDEHTHRSSAQSESSGAWYFHREKSASLKFTLKGLDLTFGPPGTAGGMLIRAVAEMDSKQGKQGKQLVEGPSLSVNKILRAAGVDNVLALKQKEHYFDTAFAPGGLLRIERRAEAIAVEIRIGPRIGLKGTKLYADAAYRYRAKPELTKKDRAGICSGRQLATATIAVGVAPVVVAVAPVVTAAACVTDSELDALVDAMLV